MPRGELLRNVGRRLRDQPIDQAAQGLANPVAGPGWPTPHPVHPVWCVRDTVAPWIDAMQMGQDWETGQGTNGKQRFHGRVGEGAIGEWEDGGCANGGGRDLVPRSAACKATPPWDHPGSRTLSPLLLPLRHPATLWSCLSSDSPNHLPAYLRTQVAQR